MRTMINPPIMRYLVYLTSLSLLALLTACGGGRGLNVFSVQQDLELGRQTHQQILNSPGEYPILPRSRNPGAYEYLQGLTDDIVRRGNVPHADVFPYEVTIIDADVQNAFATAGGYLYVYTGLVKFIDSEDALAGIMAHEIAHAAERHVTEQATKRYGLSTLLTIVTKGDDPGALEQIAAGLATLRFSRGAESEADARSVDYLCNSQYAANGAAQFFEKSGNGGAPPEFLSTHPSPAGRVESINARAQEQGCGSKGQGSSSRFQTFQRSL